MTVKELLAALQHCPPEAIVEANFDVSDHDTTWPVYAVEASEDEDIVLIRAA